MLIILLKSMDKIAKKKLVIVCNSAVSTNKSDVTVAQKDV